MSKNKITICAIILSLISLIVLSFAYFTDHVSITAETETSVLDVTIDDLSNQNSSEEKEVLSPGGKRAVKYKITNVGNIKADLKEVIVLSVTDKNNSPINLSGSSESQSEFDLYKASDVEFVDSKGYMPKAGATPLSNKVLSNNRITYTLPEFSLSAGAEVVTDYVLIFKNGVSTDFSNACLSLDISVLSKQNINTNESTWTEIENKKIL